MRTMDSLGGSSTDRRMWRRLLPLCNLVLATCLIVLGDYQQHSAEDRTRRAEAVQSQTGGVGEWTPPPRLVVAPAIQVAYAVDFPALIVTVPFKLLNANVVVLDIAFCCGVILVWYFVGLLIDSRARVPHVSRIAIFVLAPIGLVLSLLGVWFGGRAVGMHYFIPPLGAVLWSAALGAYSAYLLKRVTKRTASFRAAPES
jgi:hypothetical protein